MIIYDCEIIKAIQKKGEERIEGIEYCDGWRDFANMGISVIGAYDYAEDRYRVFCDDNFGEFEALVDETDCVIGFNSLAFDNQLCREHGIEVPDGKTYDLLVSIWAANGLGPVFKYPSHAGYGLDAMAKVNEGQAKSGHGALAPVDWQRGRIGSVIDYCLQDVALTKKLVDRVIRTGELLDPKTGGAIGIRKPGE